MSLNGGLKIVLPILATVAIVAPLGWMWQTSRVPGTYSVMTIFRPPFKLMSSQLPNSPYTGVATCSSSADTSRRRAEARSRRPA